MWTVCWQGCAALASLAVDDAVAQQVAALGGSAIVMAVRSRIDDFGLALALSGCCFLSVAGALCACERRVGSGARHGPPGAHSRRNNGTHLTRAAFLFAQGNLNQGA